MASNRDPEQIVFRLMFIDGQGLDDADWVALRKAGILDGFGNLAEHLRCYSEPALTTLVTQTLDS